MKSRTAIGRRDFLARGSASMAAPILLPALGLGMPELRKGDSAGPAAVQIAWLEGSNRLASPAEFVREWDALSVPAIAAGVNGNAGSRVDAGESGDADLPMRLVPAAAVSRREDRITSRGVLLGVHGIRLPRNGEAALSSLTLRVGFPEPAQVDGRPAREYLAFHYEGGRPAGCSAQTCFRVPLGMRDDVGLRLSWIPAAPHRDEAAREERIVFSADDSARRRPGLLPLRRGIYFLGIPSPSAGSFESLVGYEFSRTSSAMGRARLHRPSWLLGRDFDPDIPYLVLSLDHGDATGNRAEAGPGERHHV